MNLCKFKVSLIYGVSFRTARAATQRNPVTGKQASKETKTSKKKKKSNAQHYRDILIHTTTVIKTVNISFGVIFFNSLYDARCVF